MYKILTVFATLLLNVITVYILLLFAEFYFPRKCKSLATMILGTNPGGGWGG